MPTPESPIQDLYEDSRLFDKEIDFNGNKLGFVISRDVFKDSDFSDLSAAEAVQFVAKSLDDNKSSPMTGMPFKYNVLGLEFLTNERPVAVSIRDQANYHILRITKPGEFEEEERVLLQKLAEFMMQHDD